MSLYVGIDPGASGGIAIIDDEEDGVMPVLVPMPKTEKDVWRPLSEIASDGRLVFAVIEKVGGYIPGSRGNIGSAMFRFGMSCGFLRGCLIAAAIPFDEVAPKTWQKALGVIPRRGAETRGQFKNRLKAKAQQLFPRCDVTLAIADALLLAEHCRRIRS